ncbi:MAG: hypothetical protein HQL63_08335 [Magnetococcales bacterium]|nr:hypothetical protein [Magnetococcales bacterium]MBF0322427.1 hypothetical protein [Magnetococcales bacterium]
MPTQKFRTMLEVYDQAAMRHFRDAQLLEKEGRLANADQLYGFAAECAIKFAVAGCRKNSGSVEKKHINDLWGHETLLKVDRKYKALLAF